MLIPDVASVHPKVVTFSRCASHPGFVNSIHILYHPGVLFRDLVLYCASPPFRSYAFSVLLTLMAFSLYPRGGLVLLLYSFLTRATSWVTPAPVMSSFICWCHVLSGSTRRLVPGIARSIILRVTLFASVLWTCPNQRPRSLHITSSIGERCNMRRIFSFCR